MTNKIGPYEIRAELGRGAMAVVWRAWDPALERDVAIKEPMMPAGADSVTMAELAARFVREGRAAGKLNHPGIVTIYNADIYDGRPAIVMELIEGQTLSELIGTGRMSHEIVPGLLDQLLDAVGFAHSRGIVHRDIKPDNVFLTDEGRVKLADFGIAHVGSSATLTQAGTVMGTPGYMSPEQVTGAPVDGRSDIFSIGAIAYELLTGRNPFGATDGAAPTTVMYRIVHEDPPPPEAVVPQMPGYLGGVVARALAKAPEVRYQSAEEMRADLRGQQATPVGPPPTYVAPLPRPAAAASDSNRLLLILGAVGIVAVALMFVFANNGGGGGVSTMSAAPAATTTPAAAPEAPAAEPEPVEPEPEPAPEPPDTYAMRVTDYGGTVTLPRSWRQVSVSPADGASTFKAEGPGGAYVRVDMMLDSPGRFEDQVANARGVERGVTKRDYRLIALERETFNGFDAARLEFVHTDSKGNYLHKLDMFFQVAEDSNPTAIVVAWPPDAPSSVEQEARAVLESFRVE